uniref:Uncharacterized protein n=1 Tax=Meloidogyne incognita TaxID=6306 RepID=A0A914KIM2_MELIC
MIGGKNDHYKVKKKWFGTKDQFCLEKTEKIINIEREKIKLNDRLNLVKLVKMRGCFGAVTLGIMNIKLANDKS